MYKILCACMLVAAATPAEAQSVLSLSPSTGQGQEATLALTVAAPNGVHNVAEIHLLIRQDITARAACHVVHYPGTETVLVRNDEDTAWSAPVSLGTSGTAANSQCAVLGNVSGISVERDAMVLRVHLHFARSFSGIRRIWAQTIDRTDAAAARWHLVGEWIVPEARMLFSRVDRAKIPEDVPETIELSSMPAEGTEPRVFRNGLLLAPVEDYNLTGRTVVFVGAVRTGDLLHIEYTPACTGP